jgi:tRNA(Ile)-lysidine synthase TilS/MesJ
MCARLRRGTLHRLAVEAGCHTVALGHHQDDAAQTVLMNLLSGGTLGCFSPKSYLDRSDVTLIRPLIFLKEREIEAFVRKNQLPVLPSRCPVDGKTHRQEVKELIAQLSEK